SNPEIDNGGALPNGAGGNACNPPTQGCACTTPGEERKCGVTLGVAGDKLRCSEGTMLCQANSAWGACVGGTITTHNLVGGKIHTLDLSNDAGACGDPCDPYCQTFSDDATGLDA